MTSVELQISPPTTELVSNLKTVCQREGYGFSDKQIGLIASAIAAMQKMEPADRWTKDGEAGRIAFLSTWLNILNQHNAAAHVLAWMQESYVKGRLIDGNLPS